MSAYALENWYDYEVNNRIPLSLLESSIIDEFTNMDKMISSLNVVSEAADSKSMLDNIKQSINKILEALKTFFANVIAKIKETSNLDIKIAEKYKRILMNEDALEGYPGFPAEQFIPAARSMNIEEDEFILMTSCVSQLNDDIDTIRDDFEKFSQKISSIGNHFNDSSIEEATKIKDDYIKHLDNYLEHLNLVNERPDFEDYDILNYKDGKIFPDKELLNPILRDLENSRDVITSLTNEQRQIEAIYKSMEKQFALSIKQDSGELKEINKIHYQAIVKTSNVLHKLVTTRNRGYVERLSAERKLWISCGRYATKQKSNTTKEVNDNE